MMKRTIPYLFEKSVAQFGGHVYMWEKTGDKYNGTTYTETKQLVYQFAAGLMSMGIEKGDRIGLVSEGKNRWVISELGIAYAGGINVPMSVKLDPQEILFRLRHSGCCMVIVSAGQLSKVREIIAELTDLKTIVIIDQADNLGEKEHFFDEIAGKGIGWLESNKQEFDLRWQGVDENDAVNICYTSGTTADPKGIMLSHLNYVANVEQATSLFEVKDYHRSLLILPWDHAFAHTVGIYALMKAGASLASIQLGKSPADTLKNIPINIRDIRPTFLLSVPALAKNFRKNIERGIQQKGNLVERLFKHALRTAYEYNGNGWDKGRGLKRKMKKPLLWLYDKILFKKIREGFGGKLEFFVGGGALLDIELQRFFYAIGMPMFQGYGLTEAAPVISTNTLPKHKFGSSGLVVPDLELKICDDKGNALPVGEKGEIVVKGDNVMLGYWKNETATAESLKNGWLHTGDMGYMDADGFLFVLGRFKSLLIANDGEKYSPEGIEEAIVDNSPYIEQCMLYNNQNPYTVALFVPVKETITAYLKKLEPDISGQEAACKALKLLSEEVDQYFKGGRFQGVFPERWLPSAIGVLSEGFTEQNKMMNSTLKMVRGKIVETHQEMITFLYTPEARDICNKSNISAMMKLLNNG